jgi:hypothetical protein
MIAKYDRENGDSIAFVNFSGNPGRPEILVKDRYTHFWICNNQLEHFGREMARPAITPSPSSCKKGSTR